MVENSPDSVVCSIHVDNILGQGQYSLAHLILCHDGTEVGHCFRVVVRVCDCGERVWAAVILRQRDNVVPVGVVGVFAHGCYDVQKKLLAISV